MLLHTTEQRFVVPSALEHIPLAKGAVHAVGNGPRMRRTNMTGTAAQPRSQFVIVELALDLIFHPHTLLLLGLHTLEHDSQRSNLAPDDVVHVNILLLADVPVSELFGLLPFSQAVSGRLLGERHRIFAVTDPNVANCVALTRLHVEVEILFERSINNDGVGE